MKRNLNDYLGTLPPKQQAKTRRILAEKEWISNDKHIIPSYKKIEELVLDNYLFQRFNNGRMRFVAYKENSLISSVLRLSKAEFNYAVFLGANLK